MLELIGEQGLIEECFQADKFADWIATLSNFQLGASLSAFRGQQSGPGRDLRIALCEMEVAGRATPPGEIEDPFLIERAMSCEKVNLWTPEDLP